VVAHRVSDILKFGKKFDREFAKIDASISEQIVKKIARLKENPASIGKPLSYTHPPLWEFKAEVFRIFYLVYEHTGEIRLLSVKHKDECDEYIRKGYRFDIT
jgi:mRNA-degrading endonuclease RelE of RelBE toxin-antitoxin system